MKLDQTEIEALKLFNEKASKLESYSFLKSIQQSGSGIKLDWKKDQGASISRKGPNEESIDASILTIRFFIQDNEKCSIRNISKIYEKLEDEIDLKKYFIGSRDNLNNFLALATYIDIGGKKIIRREVLDVFIYGGLSHANLQKKKDI